jgi:hypothetical protein
MNPSFSRRKPLSGKNISAMDSVRIHHRPERAARVLLIGVASAISVAATFPVIAQAATRSHHTVTRTHSRAGALLAGASAGCNKVSPASVSKLIGYTLPAVASETFKISPTAADLEIAGTSTLCIYGGKSADEIALTREVYITYEITSKPVTLAKMQKLAGSSKQETFTFSKYVGLGVPAYYDSFVGGGGITGQGLTAATSSTHFFTVTVYESTASKSTLAAFVKLAEKL